MPRTLRRADALVFGLVLLGAGYFHQGGGWNQNARFAMVRAVVEERSLAIDDFLLYQRPPEASLLTPLERLPVERGNFERGGRSFALAWRSGDGGLLPVDPAAAGNRRLVAIDDVAATGDVSYFGGHFHPNKAPGTSLAAVPGYAMARLLLALLGVPADSWTGLTIGAWLASLLSIGLATAAAAVLVLRIARDFATEASARLAALAFAFCTMAWPYSTLLFEHNLIAAALVGSVYAILGAASGRPASTWMQAAGALAGAAAITNYIMALPVVVLSLWAFERSGRPRDFLWFSLGVLWPFLVIVAYNVACFGTPWTTNYEFQSPMFRAQDRFLDVFASPRLDVLVLLLFSPFRGLFFTSPVLLMAVAGLARMAKKPAQNTLAGVTVAIGGFLLLMNASFNGWDGGWTAVPRYLAPAMGLMALPLAMAFDRWRVVTGALAALSFALQLLLTSVDPQVPIGDVGNAGVQPSEVFFVDPTTRYVLPLFTSGRAWPLLDEAVDDSVRRAAGVARDRGQPEAEIERGQARLRDDLRARIERGDPSPFPLAAVRGPVSANPIGVCEGYYFRVFPAGSAEASGNSFNAGELLFPGSRWSLLPLLLAASALLLLLRRTPAPITDQD